MANLNFNLIGQDNSTNQSTANKSAKLPNAMGKDEFLHLLVTQLQYQDPLKPMDDQQFIGQMAQFSALEQMQNLNASYTTTKALNLVGKYITSRTRDDNDALIKGNVDSVRIDGSKAFAVVNGHDIPVDDITEVKAGTDAQDEANISKYTGMLGKSVRAIVEGTGESKIYEMGGKVSTVQILKGQPVVMLNGVDAKVESLVLSAEEKLKLTNNKDYLTESIGKVITAVVLDGAGNKTQLSGKVVSVTGDAAKPDIVLDNVGATLDSIYQIN